MCSTVPGLFKRAILQSGTASTLNPLSLESYDKSYKKLLKILDIPLDGSREERLEKLRSVPVEKFPESYKFLDNSYPAFPGVEGWFWKEPIDGKNGGKILASCDWVTDVVIGDCLVEVLLPDFLTTGQNLSNVNRNRQTRSTISPPLLRGTLYSAIR
jgi:hypothetical protein